MITCKLCSTTLTKKHLRRDGSMLCPVCGQVYWKAAVDKVLDDIDRPQTAVLSAAITEKYRRESRRSTERIVRQIRKVSVA